MRAKENINNRVQMRQPRRRREEREATHSARRDDEASGMRRVREALPRAERERVYIANYSKIIAHC